MATPKIGYYGERLDLLIRQGATLGPFEAQMFGPVDENNPTHVAQGYGDPINLTDCTIRGKIRKTALSATVTADLVCTITDALLGKYTFGLSATATALIPCGERVTDKASQYVWDLELVDALARVIPLYYGAVPVLREVTR
jgi:hypothetical protein